MKGVYAIAYGNNTSFILCDEQELKGNLLNRFPFLCSLIYVQKIWTALQHSQETPNYCMACYLHNWKREQTLQELGSMGSILGKKLLRQWSWFVPSAWLMVNKHVGGRATNQYKTCWPSQGPATDRGSTNTCKTRYKTAVVHQDFWSGDEGLP